MSEHVIANAILPGDLVYDVGANQGDKAEWFLRRGARVVCVEPQPQMLELLHARFDRNPDVTIVGKALGRSVGELPMSICSASPTISTLSPDWKQGRFVDATWDSVVTVQITTLDLLVAEHGVPRYIKVDVEGFEREVFSGLSQRLGVVSFEFTSEYIANAFEVVRLLLRQGYTRFNVSLGENPDYGLPQWVSYQDLVVVLMQNCQQHPKLWGDIYAN
jgi:FkbM family methyltransferase